MTKKLVYVDFETGDLTPEDGEIITIQWQEVDANTGEPMGDLVIKKRWKYGSDKDFIHGAVSESKVEDDYGQVVNFLINKFPPKLGFNLFFEQNFLEKKFVQHDMPKFWTAQITGYDTMSVDLKHVAILVNGGNFKGSGLDNVSEKKTSGLDIPVYFREERYNEIVEYVEDETRAALKFYRDLLNHMKSFPQNK